MAQVIEGQRVHCILYGGRDGSIYRIQGEQQPETVHSIGGGIIQTGGNACFDIVWDNGTRSLGIPEAILHGVQWRIYDEFRSPEQVAQALAYATLEEARRKALAEEEAARRQTERERLANEYTWLQQVNPEEYSQKTAAKNIRTELKRAYKGVKFSVSMRDSSILVHWVDGPVGSQVKAITDKYLYGQFDGMEDIYRDEPTPWTNLFGYARYISTRREFSEELLQRALTKLVEVIPGNMKGLETQPTLVLTGYAPAPEVPGVNSNVRELVQALAAAYDCVAEEWSKESIRFSRFYWLMEG